MIALVRKYISSHLSLPTLANGLLPNILAILYIILAILYIILAILNIILAILYIYVMQHNEGCART